MISIIAAIAKNGVIGNKNEIPWYIPEDLKRTKEITMGHPIIMGKATHESISKYKNGGKWETGKLVHRLLPGRTNIIITSDKNYKVPGGIVVHSIEEALKEGKKALGNDEIFFIGGASIYKQAINFADKLYITMVDIEPEGDTLFPEIDPTKWIKLSEEKKTIENNEQKILFSFIEYKLR